VKELDAGDVYAHVEVPITKDDDGETLTVKVADAGARLLAQHIDALTEGKLPRTPQPTEGVTYAHMLKKEEGRIDWRRDAEAVCNHARAMHPWPGAHTLLKGEVLKLFSPRVAEGRGAPGTVIALDDVVTVACAAGAVAFADAQLPGKKRLPASALKNGRVLAVGDTLGGETR
jgi:methionyl-tRNA formyltransferase